MQAASVDQPVASQGAKKRKASSSLDSSEDDSGVPMLKKRQLFRAELGDSSATSSSGKFQEDCVDIGLQQTVVRFMDVDCLEKEVSGLVDRDLGDAAVGLLCLQRFSSSDSEVHMSWEGAISFQQCPKMLSSI